MSSPITGVGGNALTNWGTTTSPPNRPAAAGASGQSFAQIAAGLGIGAQTYDTGSSGGPDGTTAGPDPTGSGTVGGSGGAVGTGGTGASGTDQGGTSVGSGGAGPSSGIQSGVGATTGTPGGSAQGTGASTGATGGAASLGGTAGMNGTGATGAAGGGTIADLSGTDTFLQLLVAQLKNQDPTSPMDDQAFVTELAQFNTVEQMINLKQSIDTQTTAQQASEGISLLGRTISYAAPGAASNQTVTNQGTVTGVS
ncbi:MAG: flagellar hook capping FlgD N-terminal domain-containing protein, partial [Chloroflexota bacterium]